MTNRLLGVFSLIAMLAVNAALLICDVFPYSLSGEPPQPIGLSLEPNQTIVSQLGIFKGDHERIGWSWTTNRRSLDGQLTMRSATVIADIVIQGLSLPSLRIDSHTHYNVANELDTISIDVSGLPYKIELKGDLVPPDQFPCAWTVGSQSGSFLLNARATRALGDAVRPFDGLKDLHVGQTWRLQLINPLAEVVPGFGQGFSPDAVLARVTRREKLQTEAGLVDTLVIEAQAMHAWVGLDGRVLRQEIEMPVLGRLILEEEPYDEMTKKLVLEGNPSSRPD